VGEIWVRRLEPPTDAEIAELTAVFDAYRAHYGEVIEPSASAAWLAGNLERGRLSAFIARIDGELAGFATTIEIPASLRLSRYWQIRDLFVVPGRRRLGVGRALLGFIRTYATSAGASRLAVQTEDDNAAARRLYEVGGFTLVEGYIGLVLPLTNDE
jgi:GNAT superfamily N-acetyltransferase